MLFNSFEFIFAFLPVALVVFVVLRRYFGVQAAQISLVLASLIFYAWSNIDFLPLLVVSILTNFLFGRRLARLAAGGRTRSALLFAGVSFNLLLLSYFKYGDFIAANLRALTGLPLHLGHIALPVGISFYTFTQIAFLVDAARGKAEEYDLTRYSLFVTFFPHLIAGPIIHHKEMMPQFRKQRRGATSWRDLSVGIVIVAIGLAKKVLVADTAAKYATPVFAGAAAAHSVTSIEAWGAALAFTMQIYFDFSGYSDMAIGLARLFGIRLPLNFHSPYKSENIIEFWRRWHMTLSRFLRDYLYIPLGGNRHGPVRRYINLMLTMLIGGLWHGAAWTFVVWGGLHGVLLVLNHAWRAARAGLQTRGLGLFAVPRWFAVLVTFVCVVFAWVVFRAPDFPTALAFWRQMLFLDGFTVPANFGAATQALAHRLEPFGVHAAGSALLPLGIWLKGGPMLAIMLAIVWFAPNTQELMRRYRPAVNWASAGMKQMGPAMRLNGYTLAYAVALFVVSVCYFEQASEFLYFQF